MDAQSEPSLHLKMLVPRLILLSTLEVRESFNHSTRPAPSRTSPTVPET